MRAAQASSFSIFVESDAGRLRQTDLDFGRHRVLLLVSRALGHRDVKSTQRYAHLADRALARAVNEMW